MKVLNAAVVGTNPANSVYVGRPGPWGNPFVIGKDGDRDEVIEKYRAYILEQPDLIRKLSTLYGKNLICWCAPLPCHADVLVELVKEREARIKVYQNRRARLV